MAYGYKRYYKRYAPRVWSGVKNRASGFKKNMLPGAVPSIAAGAVSAIFPGVNPKVFAVLSLIGGFAMNNYALQDIGLYELTRIILKETGGFKGLLDSQGDENTGALTSDQVNELMGALSIEPTQDFKLS